VFPLTDKGGRGRGRWISRRRADGRIMLGGGRRPRRKAGRAGQRHDQGSHRSRARCLESRGREGGREGGRVVEAASRVEDE